jgi:PAS domain-containing protein
MAIPLFAAALSSWDGAGMVQAVVFDTAFDLTHVARIEFGPVYWLFTGYLYALIVVGVAWLAIARRGGAALARAQALPLIAGLVAPLVANVLLISGIAPRAFDPMPLGLALSGLALWWGALGHGLLELVPVARHVVVDSLHDGILILDGAERVVDINEAMARALGKRPAALLGRGLAGLDVTPALREALAANTPVSALAIEGRTFDLRVLAVPGTPARAAVLHDVTDRQRWQDEQARLIAELRAALAEVKTLSGLLPICAGCKKIRDEEGAWQPMEDLRARTHARFSHGMCPGCIEQWYPELPTGSVGPLGTVSRFTSLSLH